jgi:hypothetical protein
MGPGAALSPSKLMHRAAPPFTIRQGVIFNPEALLFGLDLAKELDRMAAEERIQRNARVRASPKANP